MVIFVNIATLFVIGSLIGYLIELFFRRIVHKKWVNPGFLFGPYLPIYGFGNLLLYGLNSIPLGGLPNYAIILIKVISNFIVLTLLELITGLIFTKFFHIKLWDYSDRWLNYKGIICPLFFLIWGVLGNTYTFFIYPYLIKGLDFLNHNLIYTFFIGLIIGMIVVDAAYAFRLGYKLKTASGKFLIKFEYFKEQVKDKQIKINKKRKQSFRSVISRLTHKELENEINKYGEEVKDKKKKDKK